MWGPFSNRFCIKQISILSSNVSNPLQILYKTEHFGASGASWLRRPVCQILSKPFKSFTHPLQNRAFWSLWRIVAQEADPPNRFQILQILYKPFTKWSTLEPRAPHGSGSRICQIVSKCFKSFTNPLQSWAFWSLGRLMAQETGSTKSFPNASSPLQITYKTEHS